MEITPKFTDTQKKALTYLTDNTTNELLFGGGAGGGKSFCGCAWLIISCLQYPTTRYLLGRSRLDALKKTTLNTFFEVCVNWEIKSGQHYTFNAQSNIIKFYNGSEILLKDMFLYPSDPNFDSLGSLELTGAFIDEANQITQKAKNIVLSRIRFRLDENNLIPKLLLTCNPAKNWLYSEWYIPNKQNILGKDKRFLQSLVTDNPNISKHYIETLSKMDTITKERLLYGNWEYDDTEGRLFKYDNIINLFTNTYINEGEKYISVDVARFGKDSSVICVWSGWVVVKIIKYNKIGIDKLQTHVLDTAQKHKVQRSNIVLDEDGVGGGLKDILRGSKGFINNSKALGKENYQNLKTQCYYKFADKVNKGEIFIKETQYKQDIIQELEIIQMKDVDKDNKLNIVGKDKMKEHLGRSPDIADALMMRCYFELNKTKITYFG